MQINCRNQGVVYLKITIELDTSYDPELEKLAKEVSELYPDKTMTPEKIIKSALELGCFPHIISNMELFKNQLLKLKDDNSPLGN